MLEKIKRALKPSTTWQIFLILFPFVVVSNNCAVITKKYALLIFLKHCNNQTGCCSLYAHMKIPTENIRNELREWGVGRVLFVPVTYGQRGDFSIIDLIR